MVDSSGTPLQTANPADEQVAKTGTCRKHASLEFDFGVTLASLLACCLDAGSLAPQSARQLENAHMVVLAFISYDSLQEWHGTSGVGSALHTLASTVCESGVAQFIFVHLRVHSRVHFPLAWTVTLEHGVHASGPEWHKDVSGGENLRLQEVQGCERLGKLLRPIFGLGKKTNCEPHTETHTPQVHASQENKKTNLSLSLLLFTVSQGLLSSSVTLTFQVTAKRTNPN